MLTLQEVFDKSVGALLKQGCRSLLAEPIPPKEPVQAVTTCAYRGIEGAKCAVGHLIDDAHYSPAFEGCGVYDERVSSALASSSVPESAQGLLCDLQGIHDETPVAEWPVAFRRVARRLSLQSDVIAAFEKATP